MYSIFRSFEQDKPVGISFWSGAACPYQNNNPSFRVITVDQETLLPKSMETYYLDISTANNEGVEPKWEFHHDLEAQYNMTDLSPKSFELLSDTIKNDKHVA
jgi:hypothetical protein